MNMQEIVQSIFGPYTLVDGNTNYEYIAGVLLFAIVLYSVFRIIGLVFSKR